MPKSWGLLKKLIYASDLKWAPLYMGKDDYNIPENKNDFEIMEHYDATRFSVEINSAALYWRCIQITHYDHFFSISWRLLERFELNPNSEELRLKNLLAILIISFSNLY